MQRRISRCDNSILPQSGNNAGSGASKERKKERPHFWAWVEKNTWHLCAALSSCLLGAGLPGAAADAAAALCRHGRQHFIGGAREEEAAIGPNVEAAALNFIATLCRGQHRAGPGGQDVMGTAAGGTATHPCLAPPGPSPPVPVHASPWQHCENVLTPLSVATGVPFQNTPFLGAVQELLVAANHGVGMHAWQCVCSAKCPPVRLPPRPAALNPASVAATTTPASSSTLLSHRLAAAGRRPQK